ncbi:LysM peptidoglycan-binding domain-containing protein [Sedimentitalea todarodis]|uniref:LysM peptidoglycan-binding domain-containing protein n=1 Tax=Sedimentitalea todarodis TaxID=1631240 RepID=A0ABU3VC55_9RHOB|nr:LysM peptidoglycan-binding domain-containing protein [Sedimentitalea todarodis]MDU9003610.1 LysM peptidoglycan-binding domain-containing protein [Sedimentitalea todarodis]
MAGNTAGAFSGPTGWVLGLAAAAALGAAGLYLGGYVAPQEIGSSDAVVTNTTSAPEASGLADTGAATVPAEPEQGTAARSQAAADGAKADTLAAPIFDVVRVDPDGNTVIAGSAAPGSRVVILMDEDELETPRAGADGGFVSLLTLPISDAPRVLTLRAERDGQSAISVDQIIIAPSPASARTALTTPAGDALPVAGVTAPPTPVAAVEAETAGAAPTASQMPSAGTADEVVTAAIAPDAPTPPISESTPVTVLRANADGVEVIQPAAPQEAAASQVTLDTISYSAEGEVLLRGTAVEGAAVRVYLDNMPVTDLDTNAKGRFRGKIGAAAPGIYTLRLDEVDADGQVLSRLETPFKRESPEVLQPAEDNSEETESPVRAVTVQTGDTLWAISRDRYGDGVLYVKVVDANRDSIKNPDLIYPGQVFTIPE